MRTKAVWLVGLSVVLLTQIPYWIAAANTSSGAVFGGFLFNPIDGNSYLSKMYEGWAGSWEFTLPYSADPGSGSYLFLFYLLLGHTARWLQTSLLLIFHLARALATFLMIWSSAGFWRRVFSQPALQRDAFLLSSFSAGLGWLAYPLFSRFTPDFFVAEAYPFLAAYANPHFPLAIALMLWIFSRALEPPRTRTLLIAGFASLALGLIMPFAVVIVCCVLAVYFIWKAIAKHEISWQYLIAVGAMGGIPLIYDLYAVQTNPALAAWNAQNVTPAPAPVDFAIAFLPVILLALTGLFKKDLFREPGEIMLLVWILVASALVYLPFALQRRFMVGWMIPVSGLAALGLEFIRANRARLARLVFVGALAASVLTPLLVLFSGVHAIQTQDPAVYLLPGEKLAFNWIRESTPQGAIIAAAPQTGELIPAYTGRRVVYGHPFETVNADQEKSWVDSLYQAGGDGPALGKMISSRRIDYVFFGPREAQIGSLASIPELRKVYDANGIQVFRCIQ